MQIEPDHIQTHPYLLPHLCQKESMNGLPGQVTGSSEINGVRGELKPAQPASLLERVQNTSLMLLSVGITVNMTTTTIIRVHTVRGPPSLLLNIHTKTSDNLQLLSLAHRPVSGPTASWPSPVLCQMCLLSIFWRPMLLRRFVRPQPHCHINTLTSCVCKSPCHSANINLPVMF